DYAQNGVLVITLASRDRLREQQTELEQTLAGVRTELGETEEALRFYQEEAAKTRAATHQLARRWVSQSVQAWLNLNMERLLQLMDEVRHKHERQWFSRALMNRVLVIGSMG